MIEKPDRTEYKKLTLIEGDIVKDPFDQLSRWWHDAFSAHVDLQDAVYLATVDKNNHPDARIVLLKSFDQRGLVFYTNYESNKAKQLATHPYACITVFWPKMERQIRIKGPIEKTSRKESEDYFKSRPQGAQISAWASPQSSLCKDRNQLEALVRSTKERFKTNDIPCPPHWGGYRLFPHYFEFWQGRENRLHDRICYERKDDGHWLIARLAP